MKEKLNLGCGKDIRKDCLNVDFEKFKGVDMMYDLNKVPYPFKKNSFNEIIMINILEHLNDPYAIMKEIHRIAKPDAIIRIRTPHFSSNNAWGDLQHKRGFNTDTFKNDNMKDLFEIKNQEITLPIWRFFIKPLVKMHPQFYERHFAYIFPALDLVAELRAKK